MEERQGRRTSKQRNVNERLDQIGQVLIDAAAMTDDEVEVVTSRVLCREVWTRIVAERDCPAPSSTWLDLILVGRRTVPALLTAAIAVVAWYWIDNARMTPSAANGLDSQLERVALGGATMMSDDDLLTIVMNWPSPERASQGGQR